MGLLNNEIFADIVKSAIVIFALLTAFAYMTLIERRVVAKIQGRLGPNRAGPFGMFQPVADAMKMAFKEQLVPAQAKKVIGSLYSLSNRSTRQTPARAPYSKIDSAQRSRYCGSIA